MKLVKAYVRILMVDAVIHALEEAGVPGISAIDIREMGREVDRDSFRVSMEYGTTYTSMVKLEIVCTDKEVNRIVKVIQQEARTGRKGDGLILVSPVDKVVRIRTGETSEDVLEE